MYIIRKMLFDSYLFKRLIYIFFACIALLTGTVCLSSEFVMPEDVIDLNEEQVVEFSFPGKQEQEKFGGRIERLLWLDEDTLMVLTSRGLFYLGQDLAVTDKYKFDSRYLKYMNFITINNELHIVGILDEDRFFGFGPPRGELHILRIGESSPIQRWNCGLCYYANTVFLDYEDTESLIVAMGGRWCRKLRLFDFKLNEAFSLPYLKYYVYLRVIDPINNEGKEQIYVNYQHRKGSLFREFGTLHGVVTSLQDFRESRQIDDLNIDEPVRRLTVRRSQFDSRNERLHVHANPETKYRELWGYLDSPEIRKLEVDPKEEMLWSMNLHWGIRYIAGWITKKDLHCKENMVALAVLTRGGHGCPWSEECGTAIVELKSDGRWRPIHFSYNLTRGVWALDKSGNALIADGSDLVKLIKGKDYCSAQHTDWRESTFNM